MFSLRFTEPPLKLFGATLPPHPHPPRLPERPTAHFLKNLRSQVQHLHGETAASDKIALGSIYFSGSLFAFDEVKSQHVSQRSADISSSCCRGAWGAFFIYLHMDNRSGDTHEPKQQKSWSWSDCHHGAVCSVRPCDLWMNSNTNMETDHLLSSMCFTKH